MSGGKGGSQTAQVEIPQWLSNAAQANLAQGRDVSRIGYTPYYGPDVAALTPAQQASRANIGQFAEAFGMQGIPETSLGTPTTYAGGIQGYSAGGLYDQAVQELASKRPGQYTKMMENFVDPYTQGGFQDRYSNYFNQPVIGAEGTPGGEFSNTNSTGNYSPTVANIEFNGQIYNVADPAGLAAYNAAMALANAGNSNNVNNGNNNNNNTPPLSAADVVSQLRGAPDWSGLGAQGRISRVVEAANTYGLSAAELAAATGYTEAQISAYL